MNLTVGARPFADALQILGNARATRTTLPILQNYLLSAKEHVLSLTATNLECAIQIDLACHASEDGDLTVPGKLLADFVGSLSKDATVQLEAKKDTLKLTSGLSFKASLRGMPAEEFPSVPRLDGPRYLVDTKLLTRAIEQVAFCAATDDSRPILSGVNLTFGRGIVKLAAADGFRLATTTIEGMDDTGEETSVTVPAKALSAVAKVAEEGAGTVTIGRKGNAISQLQLGFPNLTFTTRVIEGTFPDVTRIIPPSFTTTLYVDRKEFDNAVRAALLVAGNNIVPLTIREKAVRVAGSGDEGETELDVPATIEGDALDIAFNGAFLRQAAAAISTEKMKLSCNSPAAPGVITPTEGNQPTLVLMPMHRERKA